LRRIVKALRARSSITCAQEVIRTLARLASMQWPLQPSVMLPR
jgi:hypothetical protein